MKQYFLYLVLLMTCILSSCRNYKKEFEILKNELNQKGVLLDSKQEFYLLLYEEKGEIKANNLDSCWTIFSPKKTLKTYTYQLSIENNGNVKVTPKIENVNLYDDDISYKGEILGNNKFYIKIYPKMLLEKNENIQFYSYDNDIPNIINPILHMTLWNGESNKVGDGEWSPMSINASILSDKLNLSGLELESLPGKLTIYFFARKDKIIDVSNIMKYTYKDYGIEYRVNNFKSIENIRNFYYFIKEKIIKREKQIYLESEKQNFIKLEDIGKAFSNNSVRAEAQYKGKRLKITCKLDKIRNNDNLLTFLNYKYKLTSSYSLLFGGFNIEAYSNDENFVEFNYPANVYIEATLFSAGRGEYIFTDCNLIMIE